MHRVAQRAAVVAMTAMVASESDGSPITNM